MQAAFVMFAAFDVLHWPTDPVTVKSGSRGGRLLSFQTFTRRRAFTSTVAPVMDMTVTHLNLGVVLKLCRDDTELEKKPIKKQNGYISPDPVFDVWKYASETPGSLWLGLKYVVCVNILQIGRKNRIQNCYFCGGIWIQCRGRCQDSHSLSIARSEGMLSKVYLQTRSTWSLRTASLYVWRCLFC